MHMYYAFACVYIVRVYMSLYIIHCSALIAAEPVSSPKEVSKYHQRPLHEYLPFTKITVSLQRMRFSRV